METIQRYQGIERAFEKKHRQRIERQILIGKKNGHMVQPLCLLIFDNIVKPEATSEEIEMAIDSDQAPQIFAHSVSSIFDFFLHK